MTRLYVYRHAVAEKNTRSGVVQGPQTDSPLIERGERQVHGLASYLLRRGRYFDAAYTSGAVRARQTARRALDGSEQPLPVTVHAGLEEMSQGNFWPGKPYDFVRTLPTGREERFLRLSERGWHGRALGDMAPGRQDGESVWEAGGRYLHALGDIAAAHPGETVAVFGHEVALRCAAAVLSEDFGLVTRKLSFCSETIIECDAAAGAPGLHIAEWGVRTLPASLLY